MLEKHLTGTESEHGRAFVPTRIEESDTTLPRRDEYISIHLALSVREGLSVTVVGSAILVGCGALWVAGLRLFVRSELSRRRKLTWSALLLLVGVGVGFVLPLSQLWSKFLLVLAFLPLLAVADVWLLRSGHGLSFWIRACGFEVCSVFGAAAVARCVFDIAGIPPFVAGAR